MSEFVCVCVFINITSKLLVLKPTVKITVQYKLEFYCPAVLSSQVHYLVIISE